MPSSERTHRAPSQPLPARAADCHMHVFGPFGSFPLAAERAYNVPEAPLAAGIEQPGFQTVLRYLDSSQVWVKLAGADRITRSTGNLRDAIPFIQALAAAAPDRIVWGSDWPNIGFHARQPVHDDAILPYRALDAGELLDILIEAVPDTATRRAILADNPQRLYGFDR